MRRRGRAPDEPPEFFADVALAKACPRRLIELGWKIEPWWIPFPEAARVSISDEVWIESVSRRGYVNVLTKDDAMYKLESISQTLKNCEVRLFTLSNQALSAEHMVARFERHRDEIWRRTTVSAPSYNVVTTDGLWRRF